MIKYQLYWEDIKERLLFAELDDYAWLLAEKIFRYKKNNSLYIFHSNRLSAYYSFKDTNKEKKVGYRFYLKKKVFNAINEDLKILKTIKIKKLSKEYLQRLVLNSLDIFKITLSVHYLTQPQFFEKFENERINRYKKIFNKISIARFKYTRIAWTRMMNFCRLALKEYGKRINLKPEEIESLTYQEISSQNFKKQEIKKRVNKFVVFSKNHKIKIYGGNKADRFIKKYENYKNIELVKGIVGNKGVKRGKAFVAKNENFNFKRLPKGMRKGMILIIQNAWPELSKYYKLASAIVTNEGGITSHGVVVAREFKIPCIVGTKIATKIFKTGDLIEVDANKGIVRKLSK